MTVAAIEPFVDMPRLTLQGVRARGRVAGRVLEMSLEQHYRNPLEANAEIVHTFPLPWGATLLKLEVLLNGEMLTGVVHARSDARAEYEDAVAGGDSAVLVAVNADGSYTLELGNLMAGEECVVRVTYAQVLSPEQGSLRLTLPTTIAPRYGDPITEGGFEPHAVPEADATVEYPFTITLDIEGELAAARIGSPSHPITIERIRADTDAVAETARVRLARKAWLDRDFVLVLDGLTHLSAGLIAPDMIKAGTSAAMLCFTPELPPLSEQPVTMKVLIDCSGSMGGDSIQAARAALHGIIETLRPDDRFSLSRFGSTVEHRCKALWKTTAVTLAAARRWAETLEADLGGTEMGKAIASTLKFGHRARADILLVTDGEIYGIEDVLDTARKSGQRFFVVAVGASSSGGLLRELALRTGGSCEFVAPGESVESAIKRIYHRLRSVSVSDARIAWPKDCEPASQTELPHSIFAGDTVTLFAELAGSAPAGAVRLMGRIGEEAPACLAELSLEPMADGANTLARLGAARRCAELERSQKMGADADDASQRIAAIAERYQLVTGCTSLVLVKKRAAGEKATEMPVLAKVKGMLAAGWGGLGSVSEVQMSYELTALPRVWQAPGKGASALRFKTGDAMGDSAFGTDDGFEVPAFLRKSVEDTPRPAVKRPKASRSAPVVLPRMRPEKGADGLLTPAGLVQWLQIHLPAKWPATYAGLAAIGLDRNIAEWLEFVIAAGCDEETVVRAFLECVQLLGTDFDLDMGVEHGRIAKPSPRDNTGDGALRGRIESALTGTGAHQWPKEVLEFAECSE